MSDQFWVFAAVLVSTLPATIAALGALIIAFRTGKRVDQVYHATNSMKDELVRVTAQSEFAKGALAGALAEKELQKEDADARKLNKPS